jgi:hypothetical protein
MRRWNTCRCTLANSFMTARDAGERHQIPKRSVGVPPVRSHRRSRRCAVYFRRQAWSYLASHFPWRARRADRGRAHANDDGCRVRANPGRPKALTQRPAAPTRRRCPFRPGQRKKKSPWAIASSMARLQAAHARAATGSSRSEFVHDVIGDRWTNDAVDLEEQFTSPPPVRARAPPQPWPRASDPRANGSCPRLMS